MFVDKDLQNHLETSSSVKNRSAVIAEVNLNIADNLEKVGNYRYRPTRKRPTVSTEKDYTSIPINYDPSDTGYFYTDATYSDVVIDGGHTDSNEPIAFLQQNEKEKLYYSLEDCLGKFRPRSGINKARSIAGKTQGVQFFHNTSSGMLGKSTLDTNRPRYYAVDRDDKFKYWTSYRLEGEGTGAKEFGISNIIVPGFAEYHIEDAAPFVVYKNNVPSNRVVVKMQTNVGTVNIGNITTRNSQSVPDPLYGYENQTTPVKWKIQGLFGEGSNLYWSDLKSFNQNSLRRNGKKIIGPDGYVELTYGLMVPEEYRNIFIMAETYSSVDMLPIQAVKGYAFLIKSSNDDAGMFYIWVDGSGAYNGYERFPAEYGWDVAEETIDRFSHFLTDATNPDSFIDKNNQGKRAYREFQYLHGIRIVVSTMNKKDSTFDLIEMSPRLAIDFTEKTKSFSVKKMASDLGVSGLPVGQLLVGNGTINIFDYDNAFNQNNKSSIIAKYASNSLQFRFYEVVAELNGYDYFIPMKTLYADGFPQVNQEARDVTIQLRDMFSMFESTTAPQVLVRDASVSYAVSFLLDNIGFSNYIFKRLPGEQEPIIPFFYVEPDVTVAEILNEIARSTQTAMFFDEYNNFVMMSKNYMMPTVSDRATDITLYGSKDSARKGVEKNAKIQTKLANIIGIASEENMVYNDGRITYTERSIERSFSGLEQASKIDKDKTWTYKPVMLWEASGTGNTKSEESSSYTLSAIPLKSDLSAKLPEVVSQNGVNVVVNNIIDVGDAAMWLSRYNGYLYANGEIIKYDAIEYALPGGQQYTYEATVNSSGEITNASTKSATLNAVGNVWIRTSQEYQDYFSKLAFNGKMYPTGRVRIYSKPYYDTFTGYPLLGKVEKHGRMQFGTGTVDKNGNKVPVEHKAGLLASSWAADANISGCFMDSDYLFHSIGNFQLKDAFVPHKADMQVKIAAGTGLTSSKTWKIEAPGHIVSDTTYSSQGTLTSSSSATTKAVQIKRLAKDKEQDYNVKVGDNYVFKLTKSLATSPLNGYISVKSVSETSVVFDYEIPSHKTMVDLGILQTKESADWQITSTTATAATTGSISAAVYKTVKKKEVLVTPASAKVNKTITFNSLTTDVDYQFVLTVAGKKIMEISIRPTKYYAYLTGFGGSLEVDNQTIQVDDTSAINPGQSVELYKKIETAKTGGSENVFATFNGEKIRVHSLVKESGVYEIYDGTRFKINKPIDNAKIGYVFDATFNETVDISYNPDDKAGTTFTSSKTSASKATESLRTGIIRNYLTTQIKDNKEVATDADIAKDTAMKIPGTVQSSALVFSGPSFSDSEESTNFVTYAYKELDSTASYKYFGTRVRIIGRTETGTGQSGVGAETWYTNKDLAANGDPSSPTSIKASSGGMAVLLNTLTNAGYYFEIGALESTDISAKVAKFNSEGKQVEDDIHNVLFYKIQKKVQETGTGVPEDIKAMPVKLWGGFAQIVTDSGLFVGQERVSDGQSINTVYDLGVEYEQIGKTIKFYLYINNVLVGTVVDTDPLLDTKGNVILSNKMALFVRGSAKCMFEHVYALGRNPSQNRVGDLVSASNVNKVFSQDSITLNEGTRKYALSGIVGTGYLSGVKPSTENEIAIYFDEFGTIMRECAYFNIRYDKAYPALRAKIAETYGPNRGFVVSGFTANPYGAEFLVFNSTDSALVMDGTNGNYLRIQGVTFTQQSQNELSLDDYFSLRSDYSNPQPYKSGDVIVNPTKEAKRHNEIKNSRSTYGKKEFTLDTRYVQNRDSATGLMQWITSKIMTPRKSVGVKVFALPTLQLGDIVTIDMKDENGVDIISPTSTRYVVYQIDYSKSVGGPDMNVYLSEVV